MTLDNEMSRREFIGTGISAGFALAVLPIAAWAISTPSEGLRVGEVRIPTQKGEMSGYRAMPQGEGPFPTILVIHEIFGVHEYIQDVCRRLAKKGYLAICPNLYFRQGDVTQMKEVQKIVSQVVSKVPQKQVMSDLDATLNWLKQSEESDPERVGITGFCWGGNATWMYSAHNSKLKAGVAWYGPLVGETSPNQPKFPVQIAADLKVPVLGLYGGRDIRISSDDIQKMRTALATGKSESKIIVYPEAEHGFHADYRPSYHNKVAQDAWGRMLDWFKTHGVS